MRRVGLHNAPLLSWLWQSRWLQYGATIYSKRTKKTSSIHSIHRRHMTLDEARIPFQLDKDNVPGTFVLFDGWLMAG